MLLQIELQFLRLHLQVRLRGLFHRVARNRSHLLRVLPLKTKRLHRLLRHNARSKPVTSGVKTQLLDSRLRNQLKNAIENRSSVMAAHNSVTVVRRVVMVVSSSVMAARSSVMVVSSSVTADQISAISATAHQRANFAPGRVKPRCLLRASRFRLLQAHRLVVRANQFLRHQVWAVAGLLRVHPVQQVEAAHQAHVQGELQDLTPAAHRGQVAVALVAHRATNSAHAVAVAAVAVAT